MTRILPAPFVVSVATCALALASGGDRAQAQCLDWNYRFYPNGANDPVRAMLVFDDGSGPALYVGGDFVSAGGYSANHVAKWDGEEWSLLGAGTDADVLALAVFDDGSGPALYAAGAFTTAGGVGAARIAKWDGASWSPLSTGLSGVPAGAAHALVVFDDGTGPALYAGGMFTTAGGVSTSGIAKWDGTSWSAVGGGLDGFGAGTEARAFAIFDDGSGPALFAGGAFTTAGGVAAGNIAKWDGASWQPLGAGMETNGYVNSLTVFDDGTGDALFAGGEFESAGGASAGHVAKWDGSNWSTLGAGTNDFVFGLGVFDDGVAPALHAVGEFTSAGGASANHIAKWNGSSWSPLAIGLQSAGFPGSYVAGVSLTQLGTGPDRALYVGGYFQKAGGLRALYIAKWNGSSWSGIQGPSFFTDAVFALAAGALPGSDATLYAGGSFTFSGSDYWPASHVVKLSGASWVPLGTGANDDVRALTIDAVAGSDTALYVGGAFSIVGGSVFSSGVAKWNGTSWSALGTGVSDTVNALAIHDDGTGRQLFAGGWFSSAGGAPASRIAKWNGASWSALGTGIQDANWTNVRALAVFDDGSGSALYVGGAFDTAGGVASRHVAKWDGSSWSALGVGMDSLGFVDALAVFDDGSGAALYAGGEFITAGGTSANYVAKWDGTSWSALGGGVDDFVYALKVFDDGSGPALYAAGIFQNAGGASAKRVAKWNGSSWSALGAGIDVGSAVHALTVFDDGADGAADLYLGGNFTSAGGKPSSKVAQWQGCPPGVGYCFGDGVAPVQTVDCPCGNIGERGHGCTAFPPSLGGAHLFASGSVNPNTVVLRCEDVVNNTLCTFLRSFNNNAGGLVFGDGVRCVNPPLLRFGQQNSGQMGNAPFTVAVPAPTEIPGSTVRYLVQYRNPVGGWCLPALFNASNGYSIAW